MSITFEQVRQNEAVKAYIRKADEALIALGYTEHSFAHVTKAAYTAARILKELGRPEREQELAAIAAYLHDIGNVINRNAHEQSGALMAFVLLNQMGMDPEEIAPVIAAIGNHDEGTSFPVNDLSAALILADKTDVRHTRVRNKDTITFDIHDRVNFAVKESAVTIHLPEKAIRLTLTIDTQVSRISEYFEIFLTRMLLCRRAAEKLDMRFELVINGQSMM